MHKLIGATLLAASLVVAGTGCAKQDGVKTNQYKAKPLGDRTGAKTRVQNVPSAFDKQTSDVISRHVANVKGVRKTTVLVHGREAIIGIDVKGGENRAKVENDVRHSVQTFKPGYRVHVTADKNLHARIQSIHAQSLKPLDGHPVRNFAQDVGILIRDIGRTAAAPFRKS
ncbi:YhcN/YlaJ family sporulation lipoprotein [Cohnella xylanilytica]|uniref:YhcN/YlaJ family sporulation lipoprotein n=1 Tax=Cohnella xylanilytica TaxID=557555 RepID=A0A841U1W9_9BACL|nr:YhcN/YlaJ family sporulation lipoprotein [Cohnella xylanilytica]MBB6692353.1 YhcN/YlaJ family sporulation lipoprotein [Cohnella xylanilytica]